MMKPRILVTSAAGRTGAPAVMQLLAQGFPVRAFVRRRDQRAERLERAGAEVFVGDQFDFRDLRRALQGVQRAYHCPPFAPNQLHGSMLFALAAQEARLEVVALLSGWNPHAAHPSVLSREHWMANNIYRWMPSVDVIHINPGLFAFTYLLGLPTAVHLGLLVGAFGDGLNAPPGNEDIARVAAGVLSDPAPHLGKSYRPTGPELLSATDIAAILSRVLGRKVRYRDVPFGLFSKASIAQGFPLFEITQIRHYLLELRAGVFATGAPTDHVLEVTGKTPEGFESIARRYTREPALIHPRLKLGSKLDTARFMIRMLLARVPDLDGWERSREHVLLRHPTLAHQDREWQDAAERRQLQLLALDGRGVAGLAGPAPRPRTF